MTIAAKIALFLALGAAIVWGGLSYNKNADRRAAEKAAREREAVAEQEKRITEQFKIEDIKVGAGEEVKAGDVITAHYTGTFLDGKKFESSRDGGEPISIQIGAGRVIEGWDRGVPGMKVGGIRRLTIPSELAYGERGSGPILPNTPLVFEIEIVGLARPTE